MDLEMADSHLPAASVAGGSSGTSRGGPRSSRPPSCSAPTTENDPTLAWGRPPPPPTTDGAEDRACHSFGAVFAEARVQPVDRRDPRPSPAGVYSVGRVVNPVTARSQLLGGLVMGLSAALFEESYRDARFGHVVTQDLATYHVASHADVLGVEAEWLEETDEAFTPMGSRGIGEIGIVGTPAAVANATYHATGVRVRSFPVTAADFV